MLLELLLFVTALVAFLLWKISKGWNYWSNLGIYQLPNSFPFGSGLLNWDTALNKTNFGDVALWQYKVRISRTKNSSELF